MKKKFDVLELTALLKDDPAAFIARVSEVIDQARNETTKRFWQEMQREAQERLAEDD